MHPLLLGLDIGTTNIKAVIFDLYGQVVASASVKTPTHYPRSSWAYYRPEEIWNYTVGVIKTAVSQVDQPQRIVSVAVASMGEAAVPLDEHGEATYDAIAWFDTRSEPQALWLAEHIGRQRLFAVSGLTLQPIFGLCKVLWIRQHEPAVFQRSVLWLNMADYIAFRLSGEAATNYSLASRTLALNLHKLAWDEPLLTELGIPVRFWGELIGSGRQLGAVLPEAAAATGLPAGCIVASGGHDHVCAAFALGVNQPGTLLDSIGTAEAMFVAIDKPLHDPKSGQEGYAQGAHVSGGYYMLGGVYTAGVCIEWLRGIAAESVDYALLIAEAEKAPVGSLGVTFLPHLRLASPPNDDPLSRGCFIGLNTDVTRGVLMRALLEGLAFEYRNGLIPLLHHAGLERPAHIYVTGGGTRNHLLMQIKASVLNQTLQVVSVEESTSLGAAVLGGLGAGVYRSVDDAVSHMRYSVTPVMPNPAQTQIYDKIFRQVYQRLYPTLRELNHTIYNLQQ